MPKKSRPWSPVRPCPRHPVLKARYNLRKLVDEGNDKGFELNRRQLRHFCKNPLIVRSNLRYLLLFGAYSWRPNLSALKSPPNRTPPNAWRHSSISLADIPHRYTLVQPCGVHHLSI